jgi:hypothetical protein
MMPAMTSHRIRSTKLGRIALTVILVNLTMTRRSVVQAVLAVTFIDTRCLKVLSYLLTIARMTKGRSLKHD